MNFRELIVAYGQACADRAAAEEVPGSRDEAEQREADATRLLAEIDRRRGLAEMDHQLMWDAHLDERASSIARQKALLVNADLDEARNWPRGHAEQFVRSDLKEAHRAGK